MTIEVRRNGRKIRPIGRVHFRNGGQRCCFSYTGHLESLIRSWCRRYRQLGHIDMDRVILSVAKCRSRSRKGVYASIMSLKYPDGRVKKPFRGRAYQWGEVRKNGKAALYLIKIYLPRFHNMSIDEKVSTILHELHHIHPKFNGELRRFDGSHWAHGKSQRDFEAMFECLKRDIMKRLSPMCELFLNCRFLSLLKRFGDVYGDRLIMTSLARRRRSV